MTETRRVKCPTCGKTVPWIEDELYRPFCSKKCQLIDFGEWASERHRIPAEEAERFSEDDKKQDETGDNGP